jgi:hypothetical protein
MNKTIIPLMLAAMLAMPAHAMTDDEYVKAVGKEFRYGWDFPNTFYGRVKAEVLVTENGPVIFKPSGNKQFDAEVLRAAGAAFTSEVKPGMVFPVEFKREIPQLGPKTLPMGGDDNDK